MTQETSPGRLLATARAERGRSVEDVAAAMCVRPALLRAIEADEYALCGGAVYARGHLRNAAVVVGVDPARVVGAYDAAYATPETQGARALETHQPEVRRGPERTGPRWTVAMAVTTAAVAVLAVVAVVTPDDGREPPRPVEASGPVLVASPSPRPAPVAAPRAAAPRPAPVAVRPVGVLVRLRVTGPQSWVRVRDAADRTVVEQVLPGGTVREFRDPQRLTLRIGNPAAVVLQVNGVKVRLPGDLRQPVTVVYGPGDPTVATG